MLLFLLPLIFNPFSFFVRWLPALYLAAWPVIIQTLGQDALLLHAILLITFILTCDIVREFMIRLIGFDLISMPAGILLLAALLSNGGATILSYIIPIFGTLLVVIEPIILILETLILMDMLRVFNKWISKLSNIRDEESNDLSNWEPPLTRGSLVMRFVVILITIASYLGAYVVIHEAKQLLGIDERAIPIHFNHAISLLVTLQLIALTTTIYKEAGVLSESAMVALAASAPIFIASWSYYHMKTTAAGSSWTSYFPFSIFAGGSGISSGGGSLAPSAIKTGGLLTDPQEPRIVFDDHLDAYQSSGAFGFGNNDHQLDYGSLERFTNLISPTDSIFKQAILAAFKQLIMLINSILGLSWDKLAKYYFGVDFWYILGGRLVCLVWWIVSSSGTTNQNNSESASDAGTALARLPTKLKRFNAALPINRTTLIKCLIVLVYAQMLIKEMENKLNLADQTSFMLDDGDGTPHGAGCCSSSSSSSRGLQEDQTNLLDSSTSWLQCMWNSAQACAGSGGPSSSSSVGSTVQSSRASRFLEMILGLGASILGTLLAVFAYVYNRILNSHTTIYHIYTLWLIRWRSSIIQRLMQSVFIQIYYICSTLFSDDGDNDDRDDFL